MLHILTAAMNAVLPIVLLSVLGYFLKRIGFLTEQFSNVGSKIVFRICLAVTLFVNVYELKDFSSVPWDVVLYCLFFICLLFLLGLCSALWTTPVAARRGVILHAVFRSNFAIIGLSLAASLGGDEAMRVASVVSAFAIPLYNVLGVISLTIFAGREGKHHTAISFVKDIFRNPMILGAIGGSFCILLRYLQAVVYGNVVFSLKDDLPFVFDTLNKLKSMTAPLALLVLGAQFEFSAAKGLFKEIVAGTLWRLVLAPLLGVGVAVFLTQYTEWISFDVNAYPSLIALFGSPVAVSTAVIASEMGGDEQLATQLVIWSSLGSVITIYITVCIMMACGLLPV